VSSTTT